MATSARPRSGGRQPARKPTQPAASIWKGSHGPTPAVSRALANSVTEPRTSPKPRPSARPASTSRKNTGSKPAAPPPSGRSAAPTAASTPRTATALASMPPSATSASTTASSSGSSATNSHGAVALPARADPGSTTSGQQNATTPRALTTDGDLAHAAPVMLVGVIALMCSPGPQGVRDLGHGQPRLRREHLGDLGGEGRRRDDHLTRR